MSSPATASRAGAQHRCLGRPPAGPAKTAAMMTTCRASASSAAASRRRRDCLRIRSSYRSRRLVAGHSLKASVDQIAERGIGGPLRSLQRSRWPSTHLWTLVSASPWTYAVILVVAALDAVLPLVPSETAVISAGVLAGAGDLSLGLVIAAGAAGAFAGDSSAYWLGRRFDRRLERRLFRSAKGCWKDERGPKVRSTAMEARSSSERGSCRAVERRPR